MLERGPEASRVEPTESQSWKPSRPHNNCDGKFPLAMAFTSTPATSSFSGAGHCDTLTPHFVKRRGRLRLWWSGHTMPNWCFFKFYFPPLYFAQRLDWRNEISGVFRNINAPGIICNKMVGKDRSEISSAFLYISVVFRRYESFAVIAKILDGFQWHHGGGRCKRRRRQEREGRRRFQVPDFSEGRRHVPLLADDSPGLLPLPLPPLPVHGVDAALQLHAFFQQAFRFSCDFQKLIQAVINMNVNEYM